MENISSLQIALVILLSLTSTSEQSLVGTGGAALIGTFVVNWNINSTLNLGNYGGSGDRCWKMIMKDSGLLHMQVLSSSSYLEEWAFPFTASASTSQWNFSYVVGDYDSDYPLDAIVLYDETSKRMKANNYPYMNQIFDYDNSHTTGKQVEIWGDQAYLHNDNILIGDTGNLQVITTSSHHREWYSEKSAKMAFSPDHKYVVNWQRDSKIKIYEIASDYKDITHRHTYSGCSSPVNDLTDNLAFDDSSSLVIIQTDNQNPITVLSLTNYTVMGSYPFPGVVKRTAFIPGTDFILVVAVSDLHVIDRSTSTIHLVGNMGLTPVTTMFDRHASYLYLCSNNLIHAVEISVDSILASIVPSVNTNSSANTTSNSTTNTTNSTSNSTSNSTTNATSNSTSSNTTTNSTGSNTTNTTSNTTANATSNTTNTTTNSTRSNTTTNTTAGNSTNATTTNSTQSTNTTTAANQHIIFIEMTEEQSTVTRLVVQGLQTTNSFLEHVILVALSNPFTYYFLGFINFFSLSSHYILLNMPIPEALYNHLSQFYQEVNSNVIGRFWKLPFEAPTQEMVDRNKPSELGLSTDIATAQIANFLMAIANVIAFQGINCLLQKFNKRNLLRKIFQQPKSEIIIGQYVSLIMPLTSTWVFFMFKSGCLFYYCKLNLCAQFLFFGFNLGFVIYILFELTQVSYFDNLRQALGKEQKKQAIYLTKAIKTLADSKQIKIQNPKLQTNRLKSQQPKSKFQKHRRAASGSAVKDRDYYRRKYLNKPLETHKSTEDKSQVQTREWKARKVQWDSRLNKATAEIKKTIENSKTEDEDRSENSPVKAIHPTVSGSTYEVWQTWYTIFSNFFFPLVLILSESWVPLTSLMLYSVIGVMIANGQKELRGTKVILAVYPVLFHICFIIFKVTSNNSILFYSQIACLLVLLLGSIHHFLFLIFSFFRVVYFIIKKNNKVITNQKEVEDLSLAFRAFKNINQKTVTKGKYVYSDQKYKLKKVMFEDRPKSNTPEKKKEEKDYKIVRGRRVKKAKKTELDALMHVVKTQ